MADGIDAVDVVVSGYAAVDLVWQVNQAPRAGQTSILLGPAEPEPRFGGCAPLAALALGRLGLKPAIISWLGSDEPGRSYARQLERAGVDIRGLVLAPGQTSPRSLLFYDPSGAATCCYHPGGSRHQALDETGRSLTRAARALAVAVGPPGLSMALLDARPAGAFLAWSVKADADAFPLDLRRRLLREADLIALNREEVPFVLEAAGGGSLAGLAETARGTLVVTGGEQGAVALWRGQSVEVRPERVEVANPTGAGDALFGAFLAATLQGAEPPAALQSASEYVGQVLRGAVVPA